MAESAVTFLLTELSALLQEKRQLLGSLGREIESIRDELAQMKGFLRDADAKQDTDSNLKLWITQLREISFDVEDVLDKYMLRAHRRRTVGLMKRVRVYLKDLRARDQIAHEIQDIRYRLENVTKSHQKYKEMYGLIIGPGSSSGTAKNEWCNDALFLEDDDVVGIEEPKHQLVTWIEGGGGFDVIAVVGMGGLGKTTLVKKVFDDESVKRRFHRHVWVVASDYEDVVSLLQSLIKKLVAETCLLKESPPQGVESMDVDELRNLVHEILKETSYIVVVDDIWDVARWDAIRFAFPRRGSSRGCIIITTRFNSIAEAACIESDHVYNLKPLSAEKSKALFEKRAFPRNSCPDYLSEFAENILNKCEGLPLAIVVIGGVLATKNNRIEEWERFSRSLVYEEGEGARLGRLWKLLSLSYNDLPYYLKSCFLYLSVFHQGWVYDKDELIRLWVAEGFVESKHHQTMEEVAEDYLNQLCSRSLLQAKADGTEVLFRIHDLLQEYIMAKSRELNMMTIYDGRHIEWPNKIRRLSVLKSINFSPERMKLKYLRSLLLLSDGRNVEPDVIKELLDECRFLKVLDLEGATLLNAIPDEVFKLFHLKYLCLSGTKVSLLPKEIKFLENLETLDLEHCDVTVLPDEILNLHKLRHLLAYKIKSTYHVMFDHILSVKAPCDIGRCLIELQSLCCVDADEIGGVKMVTEIGRLTKLRRLDLAKVRSEDGKELCSSLAKLMCICSLKLVSVDEREKLDLDYSLSSTGLPLLSSLELCGRIEKVPQWIPSLNALTELWLIWSKLEENPLTSLERLPNLEFLWIHDAYVEGLSFKAKGFKKLKQLFLAEFKCLKWVEVEMGAMHNLEEWLILDCKLLEDLPRGIEHLTRLEEVNLGNMGSEFVERCVEERRNEGDHWRLAHVPFVRFCIVKGRLWEINLDLNK